MSRRSQTRNQYESTTVGELAAGAFSVTVVSAAGFEIDEPIYFVIEPDVPGQREWIRVISITGNQLNIDPSPNDHGSDGRNLAGSDGDLTHPAGSKVRSVTTEQVLLDIFQDIEDDELDLTQHETDGGDPHAQAGYLTEGDSDALYVQLTGSTMAATAQIKVDTNPVVLDDLSRKGYVDDGDTAAVVAAQAYSDGLDHDHATPIAAHKALASDHHVKYTDAEALIQAQTLDHDHATPIASHAADVDAHHTKYTDANARAAIAAEDIYYTKTEVDALLAGITIAASQVTSGVLAVARIPDISATKIIAGAFRSGAWTMLGGTLVLQNSTDLGVDGNLNTNGTVIFSSAIPIDAGANVLRINTGFALRRSS